MIWNLVWLASPLLYERQAFDIVEVTGSFTCTSTAAAAAS